MSKRSRTHQRGNNHDVRQPPPLPKSALQTVPFQFPDTLPSTYQDFHNYIERTGEIDAFAWRSETYRRIEAITGTPLISYVAKTSNIASGASVAIDDSDLVGFGDLVQTTPGDSVDVLIISNGGSAEATERIVNLIRSKFRKVRFFLPANAYSAATLMCFSGDSAVMDSLATLGPIDPQINGIPTRAILRAFEHVKQLLSTEGPQSLPAYLPLINKYDLHLLEICRSAEQLSEELAGLWLSQYMFKCSRDDKRVTQIVEYFGSYDIHKSHARSIDYGTAYKLGLDVHRTEEFDGLSDLVRSLRLQYELWFDKTPFIKLFENARGIHWGRQAPTMQPLNQPIVPG